MNKKAKISLGIVILLSIFLIIYFSPFIYSQSGQTEKFEFGRKIVDNGGVVISAKQVEHCSWKPDGQNDGYKLCSAVIEGENPNLYTLTVDVFDFRLDKASQVKGKKYEIYFSNQYNNYIERIFNKTCALNKEDYESCFYNVTRKEFYNWTFLEPNKYKTTYSDKNYAYRIDFEFPQYESARYDFEISYKKQGGGEIPILLDPAISDCGNLVTHGATYTLSQNIPATADCMTIKNENITLNMAGYNITGDGFNAGVYMNTGKNNFTLDGNLGTISNFSFGVLFSYSGIPNSGHLIKNVTIDSFDSNPSYGINLGAGVTYSEIKNCIIKNTQIGAINFGTSTDNNNITENQFINNSISIRLTWANTERIWNNVFNDTTYLSCDNCGTNYWNKTKTLATNVVGKTYIGGNYYATSSGTGYSETCYDSTGDWICENSLTLATGNIDYLPLTLNQDTITPKVNITYPLNTTYASIIIALNYTVSDTNLNTCWYSLNSGSTNTTITCGNNVTGLNSGQGSSTWRVWANDSANNINNTAKITFLVDSINPTINFTSPTETNNSYLNRNNTLINVTSTDTNLANITINLYNSTSLVNYTTTTTSPNYINITNLQDGIYYFNATATDTLNNKNYTKTRTVTIDTTNPNITYGLGTEVDGYNASRTSIYVNTSWNETNFADITFNLYNSIPIQYNSTTYTTATYDINWTGLPEDTYTYYVNITDLAENKNSTEIRTIILDTTPPNVVIDEPQVKNYADNNTLELNFTIIDSSVGVDSCWYYIINSTGQNQTNNVTIAGCINTTFSLVGGDIDYVLTLFANDSLNNLNYTENISFGIRTNAPAVVLNYPTNNLWINNGTDVYSNFTATDSDGLGTCELYSNSTGIWHKNYTWINPNSAVMNYTTINLTDKSYKWNVWCNDTLNNNAFALNNFTFNIDTVNPDVEITTANKTTFIGLAFTIDYNVTDTNIDTCYFTLRDSGGAVHNYPENNTLNCSLNSRSLSTLVYGTFTIQIWGEDKADNLNERTITFTTQAPSVPPAGGGGGAGEKTASVIAFDGNYSKDYSELEKAQIFAEFYRYCTSRFAGKLRCELNLKQFNEICGKIGEDFGVLQSDCKKFLDDYNNKATKNIDVSLDLANKWNLIKALVGIRLNLEIIPSRVDTIWLMFSNKLEYSVQANKPLKSCAVISPVLVQNKSIFSCKLGKQNTTGEIILELPYDNMVFFSNIYSTTLSWTAEEKEETVYQQVTFRAYNVRLRGWYTFMLPFYIAIFIYIAIIGVISFYIYQRKKGRFLK